MKKFYDVIVVGGGHAGCEAAMAASRMGSSVLLISMDMNKFAQMSCNPAIGGIAKGQIVREIDALGGYTGIITDASTLQFRMLNRSKGPAMWSPRAQCDKNQFSMYWRKILESACKLDFTKILSSVFFSMVRKFRAYVRQPVQYSILRRLFSLPEPSLTAVFSSDAICSREEGSVSFLLMV